MRAKNLTYRMKKYVASKLKLNADEWGYIKNTQDEFIIVNKFTGNVKNIDKKAKNIITF